MGINSESEGGVERCGKPEVLTANRTGPHVAQMSLMKKSQCPMLTSGGHTSWNSRAKFLTGTWSVFPQLDLVDQQWMPQLLTWYIQEVSR